MNHSNNKNTTNVNKSCFYCINNKTMVDYKDVANLRRFVSSYMKIAPQRRSGLCSKHQRHVANAIKRARQASLMAFQPK
ncbi:MAG: 30S ribosomal protein S18 [Candidatus Magasanikbacteria bacterium]|nr:30S ribosomal protein S18 [Candidatus Magasanikbacteria bacterium]